MALICDTSGVLALYDGSNADHAATAAVIEAETGDLFVPVVLLAEIDYLLHARLGADAALCFMRAINHEEFTLVSLEKSDVRRCCELLDQYRDLEIGLADTTVVAVAERLELFRLLSFDHRHFRAIYSILSQTQGSAALRPGLSNHAPSVLDACQETVTIKRGSSGCCSARSLSSACCSAWRGCAWRMVSGASVSHSGRA